jgi:hypothetical protein
MTLFSDEAERFERALSSLEGGVSIDPAAIESSKSIVIERVTA